MSNEVGVVPRLRVHALDFSLNELIALAECIHLKNADAQQVVSVDGLFEQSKPVEAEVEVE